MLWLMEHIEEVAIIGFLVVIGVLNCFAKQVPKRDLKSPEYKSLKRRCKEAYGRTVFGDEEE